MKKVIEKYKASSAELKASFAYTICSIFQRSLSFLTLPLFTRLLTTEQYGQTTIYFSWEAILSLMVTLNLAYGSFSTAMIKFEKERGMYIAAVNGLCSVFAILFLVIYLPFRRGFNQLFELPTFIIIAMIISIVANNALLCWQGKARFEYKHKNVIMVSLCTTIITLILSCVCVLVFKEKGYAKIMASAVVTILFGGGCYFYYLFKEKTFYNRKYWRYALSFNIPLIPYYLSQNVFNQSDRIMISHMEGQDKAAIYGVAYTLAMVLQIVLNSINSAYTPWFYKRLQDGDRKKNRQVSNGIALLMVVLLLGVIFVAPELMYVFASREYLEAIWVIPPVAMSLLFLYYTQLFVNFEFYYEEKKFLVYGTILAAILNIVLNWCLIPVFGFIVAAYTTLASYIVFMVMNYWMYKKLLIKHDVPDDMFDYKTLITIAILFMTIGFLVMLLYPYMVVRYSIILVGVVVLGVYHKKIVAYISKLLHA